MISLKISQLSGQLQQIALLLASPKIEQTLQFYLKISQILAKVNLEETVSKSFKTMKMVFTPSSSPSTGFALFTQSSEIVDCMDDPDGRPIYLGSHNSESFEHSHLLSWVPVVILRSSCIEKTKTFYEQIHECVEEQHGNGPRHYSIHWDKGPFTEIYPKRKSCLGNAEFVFQISNIQDIAREMETYGLQPISYDEKTITLQDPDGRVCRIVSSF